MANDFAEVISQQSFDRLQSALAIAKDLKKVIEETNRISGRGGSGSPSGSAGNGSDAGANGAAAERTRRRGLELTQQEITNTRLLRQNAELAARANSTFANSYQRLVAQQQIAARGYQNLVARGREATQTQREYDRELRIAQQEFERLNQRVTAANRAVGRYHDQVGNYPTRAIAGVRDLIGAFGIVGGVSAFAAISKDIFQTTKQLQSLDLALNQVIGTQQGFAESQQFINRVSEAYGIEIKDLTRSYTSFYAAAKNSIDEGKISATQIRDIFESVSKAAGAMGLSAEQQSGAFLALQQMISKGNVQAEEIRGQLAERLPGAFGILAKSMGVTEIELNKLLKDGKVLAYEVLPAFAQELEKAYGVENLTRVESLTASTTRFENAWTDLIRTFNEGDGVFGRLLQKGTNFVSGILTGINRLIETDEERQKRQEQYVENSAYETELEALNKLKEGKDELLSTELKIVNAQSTTEHIKRLYSERQEIYKNIEALEAKLKAENNLPGFDRFSRTSWAIKEQTKALEQNNNTRALVMGKFRAFEEFNKKEESGFTSGDAKAKRQKADIDYLREVYELRKQNIDQQISGEQRLMDDEERNYEKRLEALNNYYFQQEKLIELNRDEELRVNDLNLKNQTESYKLAIANGQATNENLRELEYQHVLRKEKINSEYEDKKNGIALDKTKKFLGVIEGIQDQYAKNLISKQQVDNLREAGLILGGVSGQTTAKQFADIENKMRDLADAEKDGQLESLQIDLRRNQAQQARLVGINGIIKDNKAYNDLKKDELVLEAQILGITNARKQAIADLNKEMKQATQSYLDTFTQGFFSEAGLSSLGNLFKKETYTIVNSLGEIETKSASVFEKMFDQAQTSTEKFAVAFTSITEVAQEALGFIQQGSEARFAAQYAELEGQKRVADGFALTEEAKAEVERQFEERRRQIRRKELQAQKEQAIFNAVINTAQGVTAALPNFILAALVGALGAAQIAIIASRDIPAYAEGTDFHKGGMAIVGDGGKRELIWQPSKGYSVSPDKDTLVNLERGAKVFPDLSKTGLLNSPIGSDMPNMKQLTVADIAAGVSAGMGGMAIATTILDKNGISSSLRSGTVNHINHNNRVTMRGITVKP